MFMFCGGILYLLLLLFTLHMGCIKPEYENNPIKIMQLAMEHIQEKPLAILPFTSYSFVYPMIGTCIFGVIMLYAYLMVIRRDTDKDAGGSAKWNTDMKAYNKKYNTPFRSIKTNGADNIILAKDLYMSMNGHKTRRNCHQIVFGGSGTGKSFSLVKPNGLQMNSSYVFTDPKGELTEALAGPLEDAGYEIKIFNLSKMSDSLCYNPYAYIRDENGVRSMVNCIVENTRKEGTSGGEQIWDDSMTVLLQAISFYMMEKLPKEECNLSTAMKLIRLAEVDENNSSAKSELDILFDNYEKANKEAGKPESMATKCYKEFRIASGKTLKSVLITTMTRLSAFDYSNVASLLKRDELHLEELGRKKQVLFIIIPTADKAFNFIAACLYTQLFEYLYYLVENIYPHSYFLQKEVNGLTETFLWGETIEEVKAKKKMLHGAKIVEKENHYEAVSKEDIFIERFLNKKAAEWFLANAGGKIVPGDRTLPYNLRFMLDEFANVGKIPGYVEKIATMRSYKMWCTIILQNQSQLKKMWDDDMNTIIGNCDTMIFLGSQEKDMIEYIQAMLGKTTKRQQGTSIGGKGGGNESYNYTGTDLLDFNQIREMADDDCIVFIRGEKPFYTTKYNYTEHPKYHLTGDADKALRYEIPYNSQRVIDSKIDKKQSHDDKVARYKKEIARDEKKIINGPSYETESILNKVCNGNPEQLKECLELEHESEKVANTEAEKKIAKEEKEKSEKLKIAMQEQDANLWDIMM